MNILKWLMLRKKKPEHSKQYLQLRKAYYDMQKNQEWTAIHNIIRTIAHDQQVKLTDIYYYEVLYVDTFHSYNGAFEYRYRINGNTLMTIAFDNTKYIMSFDVFPWSRNNHLIFNENDTTGLRLRRIIEDTNQKLKAKNPAEAMNILENNKKRAKYIEKLKKINKNISRNKQR